MKIMLVHALPPQADEAFAHRMDALQERIAQLPHVDLLRIESSTVIEPGMLVAVVDIESFDLWRLLEVRLREGKPVRVFCSRTEPSSGIKKLLAHARFRMIDGGPVEKLAYFPDPIHYSTDAEIAGCIENLAWRAYVPPLVVHLAH